MKTHMKLAAGTWMALSLALTLNAAAQTVLPAAPAATSNPAPIGATSPLAVRSGKYEVQPHLKVVDANLASGPVVQHLGNKAVVRSAATSRAHTGSGVVPGTVVKNLVTGNLAYYSDHVMVLLKDRRHLNDLQQKFGLGVVRAADHDALVLLQAAPETDLKILKANIMATGWAREVTLDLVDQRFQPN
jgi:hypothetical protein